MSADKRRALRELGAELVKLGRRIGNLSPTDDNLRALVEAFDELRDAVATLAISVHAITEDRHGREENN